MKEIVLLDINLNSFEGEAGASGGEGSAGAEMSDGSAVGSDSQQDTSKIVYGKQASAEEPIQQTQVDVTPEDEFEGLIQGKYKEQFSNRTQKIINDRFKNTKQLESKLGQLEPMADMLMKKYNVETTEDLFKAIEEENIEDLAYKADMSVEQYRKTNDLIKDNEQLNKFKNDVLQEREAQQRAGDWFKQEAEVKKTYPEFNLKEWSNNKQFLGMLNAGVNVQAAYEVCNISNIKAGIAKNTQTAVVDNIKARGNRPKENGSTRQQGVITKSSVSSLSKADRAEIARRVAMGEEITF